MKIISTLTTGVIAFAAVLSTGAALAPAAAASSARVPVVHESGWAHGHVRPHHIYIGAGGSPFVLSMHWSHWSQSTASARGKLWEQKPGCTKPTYQCPYYHHSARVYLHRVRSHHGHRYFSRMRWTSHGERISLRWGHEGGPVPVWVYASGSPVVLTAALSSSSRHPSRIVLVRDNMNGTPLLYANHLRWTHWNSSTARARGTLHVLKTPYYRGHWSRYACSIKLWRVRHAHFTRVTLRYHHGWNRTYAFHISRYHI